MTTTTTMMVTTMRERKTTMMRMNTVCQSRLLKCPLSTDWIVAIVDYDSDYEPSGNRANNTSTADPYAGMLIPGMLG